VAVPRAGYDADDADEGDGDALKRVKERKKFGDVSPLLPFSSLLFSSGTKESN